MQKREFDQIVSGLTFEERISGAVDFQAAVLAPLILIDGTYHFLFERRAPHIRQGGEICFPGGRIDPADASPLEAALRETFEEIGCAKDAVNVIGRLSTQLLSSGSMVHVFLGILSQPVDSLTIAKDEVASLFTVPLSFFLDEDPETYSCKVLAHPYIVDSVTGEKEVLLPARELGLPACYSEPWGNAYHRIYVYRTPNGVVWGLTAKIVLECAQKIRRAGQRQPGR